MKYKLKSNVKIILFLIILLIVVGFIAYKQYQEYLYTQSYQYKLLELGYIEEDVLIFVNKLNDDELEDLLSRGNNEFIPSFIKCKYFLYKNLDGYLSRVITKDEDFFKYHGTDGYDYDYIVSVVNTRSHLEPYEEVIPTDIEKGYALLVNKHTELGVEYVPDDLVDIPWKYRFNDEVQIREEVYNNFVNMWDAAYEDGIYLVVDSGYRSASEQDSVYKYYENLYGTKYADSIAARPGFSEHQTGLALDIYSKENSSAKTFDTSESFKWLSENSYKYGFILRYPNEKDEITGYNYESWHYRFIGVELAKKVHETNLTYDEYYAFYLS